MLSYDELLEAARLAAEGQIYRAAGDALDAYLDELEQGISETGAYVSYPTPAQWAQFVRSALDAALLGAFDGVWEAGAAILDALGLPDDDIAAIVAAWLTTRQQAAENYASDALARLAGVPGQIESAVSAAIFSATRNGEDPVEAARAAIAGARPGGAGDWRAARIAQTEATAAAGAAVQAQGEAAQRALAERGSRTVLSKKWVTERDERVRSAHAKAHGQVVGLREAFTVGGFSMQYPGDPSAPPDLVVNCVPGDARVQFTGLRAITRRWFEGELIHLRFASGNDLRVTANHPVLRGDGCWIAAHEIVEGDHCVGGGLIGQLAGQPEEECRPPQIADVYCAAREASVAQRIALAPPDFHGDGTDGEVEVVAVDGHLRLDEQVAADEQVEKLGFALADFAATAAGGDHGAIVALGTPAVVERGALPPASAVGGGSQISSLIHTQFCQAHAVGGAAVAQLNTGGAQAARDRPARYAELASEAENRITGLVALDQVVAVERHPFSGHVYNLDTGDGWYISNGIAVRNCRCHLSLVRASLTAAGGTMSDAYKPTVSMRTDAPGITPTAGNNRYVKPPRARLAAAAPPDETGDGGDGDTAGTELPDGWRGVLAPLDTLSGDGRMLRSAAGLRTRPYPLPFLAQEALSMGHDGAVTIGRTDRVWVEGGNLMGEGPFDLADPEGQAWARRMADGFAGGVSVDLDDVVFTEHFYDRDTGEELDPDDAMEILWFSDDPSKIEYQLHMDDWRLIGHTAVSQPAFYQAKVEPVYGYELTGDVVEHPIERAAAAIITEAAATRRAAAASASAALLAAGVPAGPGEPPTAWFEAPTLPGPTPITVDDDGRVYGHIALWNSCHTGSPDVCIAPPKTRTGYALFHTGEIVTREGERLAVGRMTVGGGHADPWAPVPGAIEHYDETGAVVAIVRATEDAHGIVVAGALHPKATKQQVADFMLSPPSGDWRRSGGNLELVAVLSVNTPGYPVTRPRAAASADRQVSLVASGVPPVNRHGARVHGLAAASDATTITLSSTLARSLRRGRIEQIRAGLAERHVDDPWAMTRVTLTVIQANAKVGDPAHALALAAARRHGFDA